MNGITSYAGTIRMPVPYIHSQIGHGMVRLKSHSFWQNLTPKMVFLSYGFYFKFQYNNTYNDFTYNDFTYYDFTYNDYL